MASFSAGAAIGPVVGGLILAHFWWGSVFLINVPVMLMLLILGPLLLPEFRDPNAGRMDLAQRRAVGRCRAGRHLRHQAPGRGWLGTAADCVDRWSASRLAVIFFRRERRLADPLIDVRLFATPAFSAALATNMLGLFMVLGSFLFITQYLQLVLGMGPLEAGLWMAPSGIVFALGSMAAPVLVRNFHPATRHRHGPAAVGAGLCVADADRRRRFPWLLFGGMLAFCIGLSPIGAITTDLVMGCGPSRAGRCRVGHFGDELRVRRRARHRRARKPVHVRLRPRHACRR